MSVRLLIICVATLGALIPSAGAEPYWVSYEGNDYPENEGWERTFCDADGVVGQGGAVRTLEDGALVLDSRESTSIVDYYDLFRPVDPGPDETFIMRWKLKIDDVPSTYPYDLTVGVFSDQYTAVFFALGENELQSVFEPDYYVTYEPYEYHNFELQSEDMSAYTLWIDGTLSLSGEFQNVFESSRVGWGDGVQGARSLSYWDSFEFGVVPEPRNMSLFMLLVIICHSSRMKG